MAMLSAAEYLQSLELQRAACSLEFLQKQYIRIIIYIPYSAKFSMGLIFVDFVG